MTNERGRDGTVVLGLVAPSGMLRELADQIAEELPGQLGNRVGDVNWQVQVAGADRADTTPTSETLKQAVRRRMQDEGWDLAVALTDLPLRANRRPVTAHASAMYRVGLLSVPALGARSVPRRAMLAVLSLVEGLLGEKVGRGNDAGKTGRADRLRQRLDELCSPLGRRRADEAGTIAFVGATLRGNLRLLVGMVRANQPQRVIVRLSRALAASLGTAAYAMTSSGIWILSDGMAWPRLALLAAASIITLCVVLVLAHGLWERASGQDDRQAVVLFNLATSVTLGPRSPHALRGPARPECRGRRGPHPPDGLSGQRRARTGARRLSETRLARGDDRDAGRSARLADRERRVGPRGRPTATTPTPA